MGKCLLTEGHITVKLTWVMSRSLLRKWYLTAVLAVLKSLSGRAAEYSMVPDKMDGTKAASAVFCTTPTGWQGWKDDPHYWDGVGTSNR